MNWKRIQRESHFSTSRSPCKRCPCECQSLVAKDISAKYCHSPEIVSNQANEPIGRANKAWMGNLPEMKPTQWVLSLVVQLASAVSLVGDSVQFSRILFEHRHFSLMIFARISPRNDHQTVAYFDLRVNIFDIFSRNARERFALALVLDAFDGVWCRDNEALDTIAGADVDSGCWNHDVWTRQMAEIG